MLITKSTWKNYALLSPVIFFFGIVYLYPIISSFIISLYRYDPLDKVHPFVGIKNYIELFSSGPFLTSLKNTGVFSVFNVGIGLPAALFLAWIFNRFSYLRGRIFSMAYR